MPWKVPPRFDWRMYDSPRPRRRTTTATVFAALASLTIVIVYLVAMITSLQH